MDVIQNPAVDMDFDVLNQSRREKTAEELIAQGSHIKKTIKGGTTLKRMDSIKNQSMMIEPNKMLDL
jgi:hypothetical protein